MKLFALVALCLASLSAQADSATHCEQDTTLECKVVYWKAIAPGQSAQIGASASAKLTLVNEDEPSLAYCETRNGFNKNGFYIEATYKQETKKLAFRMMRERNPTGGYHTDQSSASMPINYGQSASATLSLSATNSEGFNAAEITCTLKQ